MLKYGYRIKVAQNKLITHTDFPRKMVIVNLADFLLEHLVWDEILM
jgi:hypothetical protein